MAGESIRLPAQPTALVGRDEDLRRVRALFDREHRRLVTLTGPGGSGKTRLAIAAAADLADLFTDGVHFVDLSALRDPALVPAAIAQQLELRSERDATAAIIRAIGDRRMLLVLDNFEQVVDAAPVVAELLGACAGLATIATSRRPLGLRWESEWPVRPLAAPDAVTLFLDRARDADPTLALGRDTRQVVAEICDQLDRLPLAIELAAARVRTVPPRLMRTQLEHRLAFLDSGARDLPDRHRRLANTVAWSYELLSDEDRRLFRAVSVFAGGFTETAARFVLDLPAAGVRDALGFLVECSLLQLVEHEPQRRFAMLETIREFAAERFETEDAHAVVRRRHAEYFAGIAERAEPELWGSEQVARYRELEREHDNARAALAWCIEHREADLALRLVAALWTLWFTHGYLAEGARWMDAALRLPGWTSARHRALAALRTGDVMSARGDHESAAALIAEARALFDELHDDAGVRQAMESEAFTAMERGQWEHAASVYESLRDLARTAGDGDVLATATRNLASVERGRGDLAAAERLYEESLPLLAAVGRTRHIAHVLQYLAHLVQRRGDLGRAVDLSRQSLERFQALGGVRCFGEELQDLALLAARAGQAERALRLFGAAAGVRAQIELALTALEQREHDEAIAVARSVVGRDAERVLSEGRAMRVEDALEYAHDTLDAVGGPAPARPAVPAAPQTAQLRREGDVWSVGFAGQSVRLNDSKGMRYLARLLREPGRELHALDLAGAPDAAPAGQARVEIIDPEARAAYRERLRDLDAEESEAERFGDSERAARARSEREFIAAELAAAFGLGGKARTAATDAERARVAVTKAIKAALARIATASPALGRHLDATVHTGTFCSYTPDPRAPITWQT
ncbi:MAG TPA: tetratricopeptide repeat protein [Candidatus Limnocylindria bacterium]